MCGVVESIRGSGRLPDAMMTGGPSAQNARDGVGFSPAGISRAGGRRSIEAGSA